MRGSENFRPLDFLYTATSSFSSVVLSELDAIFFLIPTVSMCNHFLQLMLISFLKLMITTNMLGGSR